MLISLKDLISEIEEEKLNKLLTSFKCDLDPDVDNCADFPFTARPDRWASLLGIISNVSVCPVLYEMIERLKDSYGFVYRRNSRHR